MFKVILSMNATILYIYYYFAQLKHGKIEAYLQNYMHFKKTTILCTTKASLQLLLRLCHIKLPDIIFSYIILIIFCRLFSLFRFIFYHFIYVSFYSYLFSTGTMIGTMFKLTLVTIGLFYLVDCVRVDVSLIFITKINLIKSSR